MATVTTVTGKVIQIETIAADWHPNLADPNGLGLGGNWEDSGLRVKKIIFTPGAADDILSLKNSKDGDAADAQLAYLNAGTDKRSDVLDFGEIGETIWPFIDQSECTLNAGHMVTILLA